MHHKKTRKTHRTAAALAAAVIMLGGGNGFTPFYPSNMIALHAAGASSSDTELGIPYARPTGNPLLRKGSKGEGVSWVQYALNKLGYNLTVDGDFGSGTEKAVKQFQTSSGLSVDGIVGKDTINKIVERLKPVTTTKTPVKTTTTAKPTTTTTKPTTSQKDTELGIPYARPTGNPLLKYGSSGEGVSWVQSALNKLGYKLTVDGIFGKDTEQAVKQFQTSCGLSVDGIVGKETINKLVYSPTPTPTTTAKPTTTTTTSTTTTAKPTTTTTTSTTTTAKPTTTTTTSVTTTDQPTTTAVVTTSPTTTIVAQPSFGDPNGDHKINAVDATDVLKIYIKIAVDKIEITVEELAYCDVNNDGAVNAVDASYILSYYAYTSTNSSEAKMSFEEYMKNN